MSDSPQINNLENQTAGNFVEANELKIYYEFHGSGEPLILLHGGSVTSKMWRHHLPELSSHFQVITMDTRGHGKTGNPENKFSYPMLAEDVAAFIYELGLIKPFICGYSDGGQTALELGMNYPHLAKGLVLGATMFKLSESYIEWTRDFGLEGPGRINVEYIEREMPGLVSAWSKLHAPHPPDYWKTLLKQLSFMWLGPLNYTGEAFNKIEVPTLILTGDRDPVVPIEEAVEMYQLIPNSELAVIPFADHSFPGAKVKVFNQLVLDFFLRHQ